MLVDLVQATTRDGVRLDGAYLAPPSGSAPAVAVDGFCLLHGTGGNFYSSTLFDAMTERLLALGCAVLRVNTRGHDGISTAVTARGGRRLGAAYEIVEDCRHDIAAWVEWLRQRGHRRIGLIGHSLGAVKAIYAAAHDRQLDLDCLVAVSPPRLSYSWFCASPQAAEFLATFAQAEKHVEAGKPATLLEVSLPLPFVITAAGYVEKYGPDERYNYLRYVSALSCPTLLTLGSVEAANNMAFAGAAEALTALELPAERLQVATIAGADHFYTGVREELLGHLDPWLRSSTGKLRLVSDRSPVL